MNKNVKRIVKGVSGVGCIVVGGWMTNQLIGGGFSALPWTLASVGTAIGGGLLVKQAVVGNDK